MFQDGRSTSRSNIFSGSSSVPLKTSISQPPLSSGGRTSILTDEPFTSLPTLTVKRLDKDLLIDQLQNRIRELEVDLLSQQQERKSEIEVIKQHVQMLEKEMNFMGEENCSLGTQLSELKEYNMNLIRAVGQRGSIVNVLAQYKPQLLRKKETVGRIRNSKSGKLIENCKRENSAESIKQKIKGLSKKIRISQEKLTEVRKAIR